MNKTGLTAKISNIYVLPTLYLEIFLADFTVYRVLLGISRDFAEKPEFRGSATAQNIRSPDYSTFNAKFFIDNLQNINWNNICKHTDANQSFSRFYKCVNKTINKHAPLRSISNRRQKFLAKPWLTAGLRKSIRVKNNLFYTSDRDKYKFYRNKIIYLTRLSKANYYQSFFDLNICNMRQTWK